MENLSVTVKHGGSSIMLRYLSSGRMASSKQSPSYAIFPYFNKVLNVTLRGGVSSLGSFFFILSDDWVLSG